MELKSGDLMFKEFLSEMQVYFKFPFTNSKISTLFKINLFMKEES